MTFERYVQLRPRARRYRDAQKTFRFGVYLTLEVCVIFSLGLGLVAFWLEPGWIRSVCFAAFVLAPVAIILHHGTLLLSKPWIVLARLAEGCFAMALVVLAEWLFRVELSSWQLGTCVFVARYWEAGEREINKLAYRNLGGEEDEA